MTSIRVLIADDHPVVRDGLRGMLASEDDFEVVGEAASGVEAVRLTERERPDVVLMDLQMPEMDGATATAEITARFPATRVLVLTTYDTDADILRAVEAGATGYLLKDTPRERLFPAIRSAARGETVLAPAVATRLVNRMRVPAEEALTSREIEVLELVARAPATPTWPTAPPRWCRRWSAGSSPSPAGKPDPEIPLGRVARRAGI